MSNVKTLLGPLVVPVPSSHIKQDLLSSHGFKKKESSKYTNELANIIKKQQPTTIELFEETHPLKK
jgi:hypothetical protein